MLVSVGILWTERTGVYFSTESFIKFENNTFFNITILIKLSSGEMHLFYINSRFSLTVGYEYQPVLLSWVYSVISRALNICIYIFLLGPLYHLPYKVEILYMVRATMNTVNFTGDGLYNKKLSLLKF